MKKINKKALHYESKCEEVFNVLAKEYIRKSKEKLNSLNRVSIKILNELEFITIFKDDSVNSIKVNSDIHLREDFITIDISRIKDDKEITPREIVITIREIEEQQNNTLFHMNIEIPSISRRIIDESFTINEASKFLGIFLYQFLIENKSLSIINNNNEVMKMVSDLKTE